MSSNDCSFHCLFFRLKTPSNLILTLLWISCDLVWKPPISTEQIKKLWNCSFKNFLYRQENVFFSCKLWFVKSVLSSVLDKIIYVSYRGKNWVAMCTVDLTSIWGWACSCFEGEPVVPSERGSDEGLEGTSVSAARRSVTLRSQKLVLVQTGVLAEISMNKYRDNNRG